MLNLNIMMYSMLIILHLVRMFRMKCLMLAVCGLIKLLMMQLLTSLLKCLLITSQANILICLLKSLMQVLEQLLTCKLFDITNMNELPVFSQGVRFIQDQIASCCF